MMNLHGLCRCLYAFFLAVVTLSSAQNALARPAPHSPPVPLLWKVEGENAELYLLGSFHFLRADDYPLSADVETAFQRSQRLVFELSPDEVDATAVNMQMLELARRRDGSLLRDELDASMWSKLEAYAQRHSMPLGMWQHFKPWFVGISVTYSHLKELGMDPVLGLDIHLMSKAQSAGKLTSGLETMDEQLQLFDGMTSEQQQQMLAEALDDVEQGDRKVFDLHDIWRRGDARAFEQGMAGRLKRDFPAIYRRINVERNQRWLPQIESHLRGDADTLVVVGALHLMGSDGVVELLRKRGWKVQRICSVCVAGNAE